MRARQIIAAVALVFFSAPIALRVVGVKAEPFENHRLAPAPKLSQGWDAFGQMTLFFTDRMPLREQAVKANRRLFETIFDTTPIYNASGSVGAIVPSTARTDENGEPVIRAIVGDDDWVFLVNSLDRGCKDNWAVSPRQATNRWLTLKRVLQDRGKSVVVLVAPDKESIYPEKLPSAYEAKDCFPADRDELWGVLDRVREPGFAPLRNTLRGAKRGERDRVYRQTDSHWNTVGSSYLVRAALRQVGGRVRMRDGELRSVTERVESDLLTALGAPGRPPEPGRRVVRDAGSPKLSGRTLLLTDSFGLVSKDQMRPYFEDLDVVSWDFGGGVGKGDSDVRRARALASADTVILVTVERNYLSRSAAAAHITRLPDEISP